MPAPLQPGTAPTPGLRDKLVQRTLHRMHEDIGTWRAALRQAEQREHPSRRDLARVYREVQLDAHLSALLQNRVLAVQGHPFVLQDAQGMPHAQATHLLQTPWFDQLVAALLEARWQGHVLIELGLTHTGTVADAQALPMQYVEPLSGTLLQEGHLGGPRIPYRGEAAYADTLLEVGRADDLGLLYKAAPHVLWKRAATRFWAEYCQLYGMPVAIARTQAYDQQRKDALDQMLSQMRAAYHIVMDKEEELEFLEAGKADGSPVFDRLIARCNSELSKLVLGQTMTTDDGSSLAQAQVHSLVEQRILQADLRMVEHVVNTELLPRLQRLGYAVAGLRFAYVQQEQLTPEQLLAFMDKLPVDPQYLALRFGLPLQGSVAANMAPPVVPPTT
jgi:phage gp29-like protein